MKNSHDYENAQAEICRRVYPEWSERLRVTAEAFLLKL
jgi:hypothetical protein